MIWRDKMRGAKRWHETWKELMSEAGWEDCSRHLEQQ